MTPGDAIAILDRQLATNGQTVILRRYSAPSGTPRPKSDLSMLAFIRAIKADEMVGNIDNTASIAVISPTDFLPMWPIVKGDKLVVNGRERNIELPRPIEMADVMVRCNLAIAG